MKLKRVASVKEILPGCGNVVRLPEEDLRLALFNVDGRIYCIEDVCTHDDGPLAEGDLEGKVVRCPRHGATFDVTTGAALSMPAVAPVRRFPVRIQGEDVCIEVEE